MKRTLQTGLALVASLALAQTPALADGLDWSLEATLTSDFIDAGESLSDGRAAGSLGFEAETHGFFAGLELYSLRVDDDRWGAMPFLGYRFDLDPLELELGIARAFADDSGWDEIELFAGAEWAADDRLALGIEAVYAPGPREWADISFGADYALTDRFGVSGAVGRVPADNLNYANVGLSYELTDILAADFRVHNSREIGTRVALSLTASLGN